MGNRANFGIRHTNGDYLLAYSHLGNRANFGLRHTNRNTLFVYSHWGGKGMLNTFAYALSRMEQSGRSDDEAYGTRIVVENLLSRATSPYLGWGITMNSMSDNEHKVPVYDFETKTVSLYPFTFGSTFHDPDPIFTMELGDFIQKYLKSA